MRRENRNFNNVGGVRSACFAGKASCLLLLLLVFLAVNPVVGSSAFAEGDGYTSNTDSSNSEYGSDVPASGSDVPDLEYSEVANSYAGNVADYDGSVTVDSDANADIELYATSTPSTVGISFAAVNNGNCSGTAGANCSNSLTPIDSNGAKAKIDVQASVRVQNSDGYKVYIHSTSNQLKNGSNVINPVDKAYTYSAIPTNMWGYSWRKATSATDKTVTDSYSAITTNTRGTPMYDNTAKGIKDETTYYMLSFAANIGVDKPAGTYSNAVTLSVVSSPLTVTNDFGIETLQEMTSSICTNATDQDGVNGISAQLRDTRDNKYYWVAKLADNKCWMTQNLDLDLSSAPAESSTGTIKTLSSTDTDLGWNGTKYPDAAETWTPTSGTYSKVTSDTILSDNTGQRSWSLGDYRITSPTTSSDCGSKKADIAACEGTDYNRFTPYATPTSANGEENAHYIVGNHYQWCAATAGCTTSTGTNPAANEQAANSICPRGWKLPESNSTAVGSFGGLTATLPGANNTEKLTNLLSSPYYFVRGGVVFQSTSLFDYAGNEGRYWSSTASSGAYSYYLYFYDTSNIVPSNNNHRQYGFSVRCLAR